MAGTRAPSPHVRRRRVFALSSVAVVALGVAALLPNRGAGRSSAARTGAAAAGTLPTSGSTTPGTVDPGLLGQTSQLPSQSDPLFQARSGDLVRAVVDGQPSEALPAFFPLNAYIQVKAIADPTSDYQNRLIANFYQDISVLHAKLGAAGGRSL